MPLQSLGILARICDLSKQKQMKVCIAHLAQTLVLIFVVIDCQVH